MLLAEKDGLKFAIKKFISDANPKNEINKLKIMQGCPHIIEYIEDFILDAKIYLVIEFIENGDLMALLKKYQPKNCVPESLLVQIF